MITFRMAQLVTKTGSKQSINTETQQIDNIQLIFRQNNTFVEY